MYVPEKLKLNKFQLVKLPSPRELFRRNGENPVDPQRFTGDVPVRSGRKLDTIHDMDAYDKYMQEVELEKSKSND